MGAVKEEYVAVSGVRVLVRNPFWYDCGPGFLWSDMYLSHAKLLDAIKTKAFRFSNASDAHQAMCGATPENLRDEVKIVDIANDCSSLRDFGFGDGFLGNGK